MCFAKQSLSSRPSPGIFQVYLIWSLITRRYLVRPSMLCSVCPSTPSSLQVSSTESQTVRWDFGLRLTILWKKQNKKNSLSNSVPFTPTFSLLVSSPGCRGANLLLRGNGPWAAGRLCHSLVCVQLGDERHLGGWGIDGGLVCDQQVKKDTLMLSFPPYIPLIVLSVCFKVESSPSQTGYNQSRPRHSSEGPLGSALLLVPGCCFDGIPE